jgi:5-methylcytosine-specific restriction endonuclease McrA
MNISRIRGLERLKVWHLKVRYDLVTERLVYDRTLTPGPGSSLYGLEVARAMNIPDRVLAAAMEIRHEILGTASTADAPMSAWNSGVQRKECAKCGSGVVRDLEVHHIQMRAGADAAGRLADGTHQNHIRNLIVLCEACHLKHHAGELEVGPLKAGSASTAAAEEPQALQKPLQRTKWSPEQIEIIRGYLRNFPKVAPKRLVYDLEEKESIVISVASLARFRTSL